MLRAIGKFATLATAACLAGCGSVVPDLQEFPTNQGEEQLLVRAIVASIRCDIATAVRDFIDKGLEFQGRNRGNRAGAWLDHWGAQIALTLTIAERTAANPTASGMPPGLGGSMFKIDVGGAVSSEATRTDKLNFFYTVKDLYSRGPCVAGLQPLKGAPSPLIQNNLKLKNWLFDQLALDATKTVTYPASSGNVNGQNVLSHQVTFQVNTEGNINPSWTLTPVTINTSGTFLGTSRNRTSDLIVTFGPLDPKQDNGGLILQAENVHFIQQLAVANATSAPQPVIVNRPLF